MKDTVYLGAEKLVYYTIPMCEVDSMAVVNAEARLKVLDQDPVSAFRKKAAEEAAKAAEENAKNDPNYRPTKKSAPASSAKKPTASEQPTPSPAPKMPDSVAATDSTAVVSDSTSVVSDSLSVMSDSLAVEHEPIEVEPPKDSTGIGFLEAIKNVRIYRKDMQVVCDSLLYTDLDSLARMFLEPVIWQEETRQYSSDSLFIAVSQGGIEKASLMSNAFIAIMEDSLHFDQIKSTEMMAYFDDKGGLRRFDALGGASAMFYLEENDALATVNKADAKMLSATFKDGELQRVYYFEDAKNDGYPVVQLSRDEMYMKGFNWQGDRRPADRNAVTPLSLRPSQRLKYAARPRAKFTQTDKYFPGYMSDIYRQIQVRDSLKLLRQRDAELAKERENTKLLPEDVLLKDGADSLGIGLDSLKVGVDSLKLGVDSPAVTDSLAKDVVLKTEEVIIEQKSAKQIKKEEREAAKQKRREEQEARWAEKDRLYEEKVKAKEEKAREKARQKKRKALEAAAKQAERDAAVFEKYKAKFEKQLYKEASRKSSRKAGKKSQKTDLSEDDMIINSMIKGL